MLACRMRMEAKSSCYVMQLWVEKGLTTDHETCYSKQVFLGNDQHSETRRGRVVTSLVNCNRQYK